MSSVLSFGLAIILFLLAVETLDFQRGNMYPVHVALPGGISVATSQQQHTSNPRLAGPLCTPLRSTWRWVGDSCTLLPCLVPQGRKAGALCSLPDGLEAAGLPRLASLRSAHPQGVCHEWMSSDQPAELLVRVGAETSMEELVCKLYLAKQQQQKGLRAKRACHGLSPGAGWAPARSQVQAGSRAGRSLPCMVSGCTWPRPLC